MAHSVYAAFQHTVQQWPTNDFLLVLPETAEIYGIEAGPISYQEAFNQVESLAAAYEQAGYGHGHRVGVLLENRPAFLLHWLALNKLGVSIVPINPDLRIAELEYLIGHSEMCLIVALEARHGDLLEAARAAQHQVLMATPEQTPPTALTPVPQSTKVSTATECALMYTSGTTGLPKGCILPNEYFLYAGRWYAEIGGMAVLSPGQERMLTPLPLFHMNALATSTMAMIITGGCLIALDRFHPRSWWDSVRRSQATVVHYLGVMPAILMKFPPSAEDQHHSVRFGFGAGVDAGLHQPFEERFGFPLLEAWAMTETGAGACIIANKEPRYVGTHCFGKEEAVVEVKIVDDQGQPVPHGTKGELLVRHRGPNPRFGFFAGYWKDQAATDEAWAGGWFHTGDIVMRGTHGYLHFIDRKRNVIRRSGENIAAVEVENALQQHEYIQSIAVAAVPDEIRGDEVMALVVLRQDAATAQGALAAQDPALLAQEIIQWGLTRLAYFKVPGYVAFVDSLPLTSTNKIQRGVLKDQALALFEEGAYHDTTSLKRRQEA